MSDVTVRDVPEEGRYEARTADGALAGVLVHEQDGDTLRLVHTGVEPPFEGQGVASALVVAAFEASRATGIPIVPVCPYVRAYLERHPEYADVVAAP